MTEELAYLSSRAWCEDVVNIQRQVSANKVKLGYIPESPKAINSDYTILKAWEKVDSLYKQKVENIWNQVPKAPKYAFSNASKEEKEAQWEYDRIDSLGFWNIGLDGVGLAEVSVNYGV